MNRYKNYYLFLIFIGVIFSSCEKVYDPVSPEVDQFVEGVNFTRLFAQPSSEEINSILVEWENRDISVKDVAGSDWFSNLVGGTKLNIQIVSHVVNGLHHFGAIIVPEGKASGSLPVLVYCHGGDNGENLDQLLLYLPIIMGDMHDDFVYVIPSFRSEKLIFKGNKYLSDGEPSPWDYDVDDALALLNVTLTTIPEADPERIGIIGFSRGGCVGMLMAVRDPRIDLVIEFFGPTDFFGSFVQEVVEEALQGKLRHLPGLDYLNTTLLRPLVRGDIPLEDVRKEMIRRSPVYFADRLPILQVHHGTNDSTVYVSQAERLIETMLLLNRDQPDFEYYIYQGGTHDPFSFPGVIDYTRNFLKRLIEQNLIASDVILTSGNNLFY